MHETQHREEEGDESWDALCGLKKPPGLRAPSGVGSAALRDREEENNLRKVRGLEPRG